MGLARSELLHQALEVARTFELEGEVVMILHGLGDVSLVRGETAEAAGFYVEALQLERRRDADGSLSCGARRGRRASIRASRWQDAYGEPSRHDRAGAGGTTDPPADAESVRGSVRADRRRSFAAAVVAGQTSHSSRRLDLVLETFGDPLAANAATEP